MLDPVSAIGVAAAAIQFLQFSLQVLDVCRQIRDDAEAASDANKELEEYSRTLQGLNKDLKASATQGNAAGRRIAE